jgi:hypothetical protein
MASATFNTTIWNMYGNYILYYDASTATFSLVPCFVTNTPVFTGTGLNDLTKGGVFQPTSTESSETFDVEITGQGYN